MAEAKHKFKVSVNASSSIILMLKVLFDDRHFFSLFDRNPKLRETLSLITEKYFPAYGAIKTQISIQTSLF